MAVAEAAAVGRARARDELEVFETSDAEDDAPTGPVAGSRAAKTEETFEDEGSGVLADGIDPLAAFEVFMGRTFDPSETGDISRASGRIAAAYGSSRGGAAASSSSSAGGVLSPSLAREVADAAKGRASGVRRAAGVRETPLSRLARLRTEAAALEADVAEMEEQVRAGREMTGQSSAEDGDALDRAKHGLASLLETVDALAARMEALSGQSSGATSSRPAAADLAAAAEASAAPTGQSSGRDAAPLPEPGAEVEEDDAGLGALELRVAELEASVGAGAANHSRGLIARLEHVEEAAAALSPEGMATIAGRASAALESLRALRAEAAAGRTDGDTALDVTGLRTAMERLEKVEHAAEVVPLVVSRLEALSGLHLRATEAVRVAEELAVASRSAQAGHEAAAVSIAAVRDALAEAGKDWAKTAAAIDARLEALAVS